MKRVGLQESAPKYPFIVMSKKDGTSNECGLKYTYSEWISSTLNVDAVLTKLAGKCESAPTKNPVSGLGWLGTSTGLVYVVIYELGQCGLRSGNTARVGSSMGITAARERGSSN
jgi:hypothetical protein